MTDLIEKAARAIFDQTKYPDDIREGLYRAYRAGLRGSVRAVLEAIRGGDDRAFEAAIGYSDFMLPREIGSEREDYVREMRLAWQCTIDHLLSKPNQEGGE